MNDCIDDEAFCQWRADWILKVTEFSYTNSLRIRDERLRVKMFAKLLYLILDFRREFVLSDAEEKNAIVKNLVDLMVILKLIDTPSIEHSEALEPLFVILKSMEEATADSFDGLIVQGDGESAEDVVELRKRIVVLWNGIMTPILRDFPNETSAQLA
jgi:hypothetical protein